MCTTRQSLFYKVQGVPLIWHVLLGALVHVGYFNYACLFLCDLTEAQIVIVFSFKIGTVGLLVYGCSLRRCWSLHYYVITILKLMLGAAAVRLRSMC